MKKILFAILNFFCFITENLAVIGGAALIAIMVLTVTDVIMRLFNKTVIGNAELIAGLICVVVFLGFGKSVFLDSFTKVEIIDFKKAEPFVRVLMDIIHVALSGISAYYCFVQSIYTKNMGTSSLMLKIPRWPFLTLAGVGFSLIALSVPLSRYRNYMLKNTANASALEEEGVVEHES